MDGNVTDAAGEKYEFPFLGHVPPHSSPFLSRPFLAGDSGAEQRKSLWSDDRPHLPGMERGERERVESGESGESLMTDPTYQVWIEEREWSACVCGEREREW